MHSRVRKVAWEYFDTCYIKEKKNSLFCTLISELTSAALIRLLNQ